MVLAPGHYEGRLRLRQPITLLGSCDGTSVLTRREETGYVVEIDNPDTRLIGLSIEATSSGVHVEGGGSALIRDSTIHGSTRTALRISNNSMAELRDVRIFASEEGTEAGVFVRQSHLAAVRVALEGAFHTSLWAHDHSTVRLEDLSLEGPTTVDAMSWGVNVTEASSAALYRVHARTAAGTLLRVVGTSADHPSVLSVEDLDVIELPRTSSPGITLQTLLAQGHSDVSIRRSRIARGETLGFSAEGRARIDATDIIMMGTEGFRREQGFHIPFQFLDASYARLQRVHVNTAEALIFQLLDDASLDVTDLVVDAVSPERSTGKMGRVLQAVTLGTIGLKRARLRFEGDLALLLTASRSELSDIDLAPALDAPPVARRGLVLQRGGEAHVTRIAISDVALGLAATHGLTHLEGQDISILRAGIHTTPQGDAFGALRLQDIARAHLTRVAVLESVPGMQITNGSFVLEDLWIGPSSLSMPPSGHGLMVDRSEGTLNRLHAHEVEGYALTAHGHSQLVATHVWVEGSRLDTCAVRPCLGVGCATTAVASSLSLTNFWLEGGDLGGLCFTDEAVADVRHGTLFRNQNGLVLMDSQIDLDRDFQDVGLIDNARSILAERAPLPVPAPPIQIDP